MCKLCYKKCGLIILEVSFEVGNNVIKCWKKIYIFYFFNVGKLSYICIFIFRIGKIKVYFYKR